MDFLFVTKQWRKASAGEPCWAFYQHPLVFARTLGPRGSQPLSSDASGCCESVNVQLAGSGHLSHFTCSKWPLSWVWQEVGAQPDSVAEVPGTAEMQQSWYNHNEGEKAALLITADYRGETKDRDKASHPGWQIRWLGISPNCLNPLNHVLTIGAPCWHPPPRNLCPWYPSIQRD